MIFDEIQDLLGFVMSDKFGFCLFEILFSSIFLYALRKDKIRVRRGVIAHIIRGEKSRKIFIASASAFTTFVLSIIFTITSYPKDGRVLLYLINLIIVFYLFFCSSWFTNKLVGWWTKWEQKTF